MPATDARPDRRGRLPDEWGRRWTRDDLLRLHVMLNAGYRVSEIHMLLSRSIESFVTRETGDPIRLPARRPPASRSGERT